MPLIVTRKTEFQKEASASLRLSANQQRWPQEILSEAYRQVPLLQDLAVEIRLDRVNEVRGVGVGKLLLKEAGAGPVQGEPVAIPVTIRNRELDPLDVLMIGQQAFPLTEEKLATHFANYSLGSRDQSGSRPQKARGRIASLLDPPEGTNYAGTGLSSKASVTSDGFKLASESLLDVIGATARDEDLAALKFQLQEMGEKGASLTETVDRLLSAPRLSAQDLAKMAAESVPPDYLGVSAQKDGRYLLKRASARFFEPIEQVVSRVEAEALVGSEHLRRADEQTLHFVRPTGTCAEVEEVHAWNYSTPGVYKVASVQGTTPAFVLPYFSFRRGARTGEVVLLSDQGYNRYEDEKLAVDRLADLKVTGYEPCGSGCFLWEEPLGWVASPYLTVHAKVAEESSGPYWLVSGDQRDARVFLGEQVKTAQVTEWSVVLPKSAVFVPCQKGDLKPRSLEDHLQLQKSAADTSASRVVVHRMGSAFEVHGTPVADLQGRSLSREDTGVVLRLLGHPGPEAVLQKVAREGQASLRTTGSIHTAEFVRAESLLQASELHEGFPEDLRFRPEVVKLAAALPPERETVDTVLALNFLNADNLRVMRGYLPQIEKTASRLAELLVASRLGMNVESEPIRLAMHYVRRVADGLRSGVPEGV